MLVTGCASAPGPDSDIVMMAGGAAGARGTSRTGVTAMTLDELTQCARLIGHLDAARDSLSRESAAIAGTRRRVDHTGDSLDSARPKVDARRREAVSAFNAGLEQHRSAVRAFNARVERHNAATGAFNTLSNVFNASCAGRAYRKSHLQSLAAPLRQAIDRHSVAGDVPLRAP
jgi:hypothetical protein